MNGLLLIRLWHCIIIYPWPTPMTAVVPMEPQRYFFFLVSLFFFHSIVSFFCSSWIIYTKGPLHPSPTVGFSFAKRSTSHQRTFMTIRKHLKPRSYDVHWIKSPPTPSSFDRPTPSAVAVLPTGPPRPSFPRAGKAGLRVIDRDPPHAYLRTARRSGRPTRTAGSKATSAKRPFFFVYLYLFTSRHRGIDPIDNDDPGGTTVFATEEKIFPQKIGCMEIW